MNTALPVSAAAIAPPAADAGTQMSVLEFIASMTGSLAGPITGLAVLWVFRRQLTALAGKIASFEGFGVKVNFAERAAELSVASSEPTTPPVPVPDTTAGADAKPPRRPKSRGAQVTAGMGSSEGKVVAGWLMIEAALREAATEHDIGPSSKPLELLFALQQAEALTEETAGLIEEARRLRNAVVHGKAEGFSFIAAQNYAHSATNIAARIRAEAGLTPEA
ncbi:hypothetical protein [Phenylobacterium sp.]|uniref:hypothetical protein n=1 Tax=Phenylobacterium sp. TaxID=1871053 RepID=UPI002FC8162D